jgi:fatty acid desaturase
MKASRVRSAHEQLRYDVRPLAFGIKMAVWFGLTVIAVCTISTTGGAVKVAAQFLLAAMFAHGVELAHQALHRTGFGTARFDRIAGLVLCLPVLVSFSLYQFFHLRHHKKNGDPDDQESFGYWFELIKSEYFVLRCIGFVLHFSMLNHFATALVRIGGAFTGHLAYSLKKDGLPTASIAKTIFEYRLMGFVVAGSGIVGRTFGIQNVLDYWLIPLAIFAPIHALIELPEHFGCDHPSEDGRKNTRSIRAGRFMVWFTNGNCFHVGHHMDMLIPMDDRLEQYETELRAEQPFKHEISYISFYMHVFNFMLTGKGFENE